MNNRKIRQIIKKHLSLSSDDNFNYEDIPEPDWLHELVEKERSKKSHRARAPRWAVSVASVIATFIFMVTSPGQAISEFLHSIDIQWNSEMSKLEIKYDSNVEYDVYPELSKDLQQTNEYTSVDNLISAYPELSILINDYLTLISASAVGDTESICISSQYSADTGSIFIQQTIYYSDHAQGMSIDLTENATSLEAPFNHNSLIAVGGYEDGYANLVAFDDNCIYSFVCTGLSQEQIIECLKYCYIK